MMERDIKKREPMPKGTPRLALENLMEADCEAPANSHYASF
jgi:hypothetical protein